MQKNKLPSIIIIVILTSITIVSWVVGNIYINISRKSPAVVSEDILLPLEPNINTEIINQIEKRVYP